MQPPIETSLATWSAQLGWNTPGDIEEVVEGGQVAVRVPVREVTGEEGDRLPRIVRRLSGDRATPLGGRW